MSKVLSILAILMSFAFFVPFLSVIGFILSIMSLVLASKDLDSKGRKFEIFVMLICLLLAGVNLYFSKMFIDIFIEIFAKSF